MKKEMKVWAMTCIAFWWLAPNQINAQQDSVHITQLSEVVVTATKFPKSLAETGKDVTIISSEQLQQRAGKDLSQILNEQAGLFVNGANSNPGKDKSVYLRGAKTEHTLILIDGIPVSDPSGVGGAFDLRLIPVDQVERIEILKGSQSTLYGTDAIAGVINIITKAEGKKALGASGTFGYGSFNTLRAHGAVTGATGLLDYHAGFTRNQADGISEASDEMGGVNFDKDGFDQNAFQLNLSIKPSPRLSVRPFLRYNDFTGGYDAGSFTDDPAASYESKLLNTGAMGLYRLNKGSLQFQYGYNRAQRTFADAFGTFEYDGRFGQAEVFAHWDLTDQMQVLGGFSYQDFRMIDANATIEKPGSHITSPYLSFFVKNWNGFSLEVGGRLASHSTYGETVTYSFNPSYLVNDQLKLFVNYSTGFKAPTLNQLYGPFGANENLEPEKSESADAGIQYFVNDRFDMKAVGFARRVDDGIAYASGYVNLDEQNDQGFEFEFRYKVLDRLTATAFYAFVEGEVKTQDFLGNDTTFNNLFKRPKHSFGLTAMYQITPQLSANMVLKSFGVRDDVFFDSNAFITQVVELKAYQLLDVHVNYSFGEHFNVFVDARNLLNADYQEVYGFSTPPVNFTTGVTFHF